MTPDVTPTPIRIDYKQLEEKCTEKGGLFVSPQGKCLGYPGNRTMTLEDSTPLEEIKLDGGGRPTPPYLEFRHEEPWAPNLTIRNSSKTIMKMNQGCQIEIPSDVTDAELLEAIRNLRK